MGRCTQQRMQQGDLRSTHNSDGGTSSSGAHSSTNGRVASSSGLAHLRAVLDVAVWQGHGAELEVAVHQALQAQELRGNKHR